MDLPVILNLVSLLGICVSVVLQLRGCDLLGYTLLLGAVALGAGVDIATGDRILAIVDGGLTGYWAFMVWHTLARRRRRA